MNITDLKKYCDDPKNGRYQLSEPWSDDKYTYASNGHILVRVPKFSDSSKRKDSPTGLGKKSFDEIFKAEPVKWFSIPTVHPKHQDCEDCNGKGKFKYHGETVQCEECDGKGKYLRHISVDIGGVAFSDVYLSWIAELPNSTIGPFKVDEPARFKFDGGEGLLMPRRA